MITASVTGTADFDRLIARLEGLDGPEQIAREAQASIPVVRELYAKSFEVKQDPAGRRWAPRKQEAPHPLMQKTHRLERDITIQASPTGLILRANAPYARYHQDGTSRMVARQILPDARLSAEWDRRIGEARLKAVPSEL